MPTLRRLALVVVATAAVATLSSCGGSDTAAPPTTASVAGSVPAFDGPYAAEFATFYRDSTSDFVRQVLADEEITDAEYAEMTSRLSACLADQGVTLKSISPAEGMTTSAAPNGGDTHAIVSGCSKESGEDSIGALRDFMAVNPENLDVLTITVDCLVERGVVPEGYGVEDFTADSTGRFADTSSLPTELRDALTACSADPLGLLGDQE